jgi:hypothetical protein
MRKGQRVTSDTVLRHADPTTTKTGRRYGDAIRIVRARLATGEEVKPIDFMPHMSRIKVCSLLRAMVKQGEIKRIRKGISNVRQPIYQRTT